MYIAYKNVLFAVLLLMLFGCKKPAENGKMKIAVSMEPQKWLVEQIGGDKVEVSTLIEKGADPESFDPTIGSMKAVEQSQLFVIVGAGDFERVVIGKLHLPGEKIVDLSDGIDKIYGTHEHKHESGAMAEEENPVADPHVWVSVKNLRKMTSVITEALSKADPANADKYAENGRRVTLRLDSIDSVIEKKLQQHGTSKSFLTWHPSLSYFARDYELTQIPFGGEGKELSMASLRRALTEAKAHDAGIMVVQAADDKERSAMVAGSGGLKMVEIDTNRGDVARELMKLVNEM